MASGGWAQSAQASAAQQLAAAQAAERANPTKANAEAVDVALAAYNATLPASTPAQVRAAPPTVAEVEPNGTSATATALPLATNYVLASGIVNPAADQDYWSIALAAGDRVWALVDTGGALVGSSRDSQLRLFGTDGTTEIEFDDDDGVGSGGDGTNETSLASLIGGRSVAAAGTYFLRTNAFSALATINPMPMFVARTTAAMQSAEAEGNDTSATANVMTAPIAVRTGAIGAAGDIDFYSITATAGDIITYIADADPERDGTGTDLVVQLRAADGTTVLQSADSSITGSLANPAAEGNRWVVTTTGTHFVRVAPFGAATGSYHLMVTTAPTPPPAAVSISLTKTVGTTPGVCGASDNISVPAGTTVYFCYVATNTGTVPFTNHTLTDNVLGSLLNNTPIALAPAASTLPQIFPQVINATVTNTGTWTANTGSNYTVSAPAFAYIPINGTGTSLALTDDSEANITSPFPITYYGVTSSNLRVGNNGGILFNATTGDVSFSNVALPSGAAAIYPFWDDMDDETGQVYWQVQGAAPNRQLIVEWFNRPHFNNTGAATFEVIFSEGSNTIRFQYLDVDFGNASFNNGASATVGLNASASLAQQFSFNTASLSNNQAILFTPPQSAVGTDTATVTALFPNANVSPLSLSSTQLDGSTATLPLTIGNNGQAPLVWTLVEANPEQPRTAPGIQPAPEPVFNVPGSVTSAKDCEAFANYPFEQPAGWDQFCAPSVPSGSAGAARSPTSTGFALNLRAPDENIKRFTLNNFPAQVVVGPQTLDIYGMDFDSTGTTLYALTDEATDRLGTVNTTTGAFTAITDCPAPGGGIWSGMAIDPVSDVIYASTTTNLYTLSAAACSPVLVGPFNVASGLMVAIAINGGGAMYGHDIATDSIYTISTTTGAATLVGATGLAANFAQGMDFDNDDGTLYIFGYTGGGTNTYGTVNLATGAVTPLAVTNPSGEFEGATQTQALCVANDFPWLSAAPASGTTAAGASTVSTVTFNAAGQACGATYTAQLCVRSNDPDAGPGNNSRLVQVPVSMTVTCASDLTVALTDSPDPVVAGTNLTYTAVLTNGGPSPAQDAAVTLPLPAGTSLVSANAGAGGSCTLGNPVVCTWTGATAPAGTRTAIIQVLVAPAQVAGLSATATASSLTLDPNPANNSDTEDTAVQVQADLSITLSDAPDPVIAGTQLTYTATVTNAGPSDATAVVVNLPTPTGTSFVSGSVSGGGSCAAGISCTISGSMAPGSSRTVTIVVLVAPAVLEGTVINATATVSAGSPDPVPGNNSASTSTTVNARADLQIALNASTLQVLINVPVTFTATSTNNGPSDAQNVSVTIALTPDFRYTSHTATGATCTTPQVGTTGSIVCTWAGATAPGVVRTLTVVAYSNVEGNTAVNASTTSNTVDPVANNNAAGLAVVVGYPFNEIPTLGQYGLVLLGLLIGLMGFAAVRRQS